MTNTPPPARPSGGLNAIWFILGGLVVLAILYFAFFSAGPAETPTASGNNVTVETPAATPAAPAAPEATTPPAAEPAPAAPATPAPATPAPAN